MNTAKPTSQTSTSTPILYNTFIGSDDGRGDKAGYDNDPNSAWSGAVNSDGDKSGYYPDHNWSGAKSGDGQGNTVPCQGTNPWKCS